jgi:hypothetical protein
VKQLTMFLDDSPFVNRTVKSVTFQGKMTLPIHRWYRLTPSFSPQLAFDIASHFDLSPDDQVLDPFSGVGTVPLCMKQKGIPACSVELNPYLHFVSTVKTRTYSDLDEIRNTFREFIEVFRRLLNKLPSDATAWLKEHEEDIPSISKPERWWSPENLMQLVCLRRLLRRYEAPEHIHDLLKMGVLGILIPVSNAKHNHVSLTFAEKPHATVEMGSVMHAKYAEIMADLVAVADWPIAEVQVYFGNSKELSRVLPEEPEVSAVITSPPYPNRFSYARETRPHMFFFDFIKDARSVGELETAAIGGTWGKATSVLAGAIDPQDHVVKEALAPYLNDIHVNGNGELMKNYVTKYFNNMYEHAAEIAKVCRESARLAYVIGNSQFYGSPLPSDEILAAIFGHFGFTLESIERMRKRQSKSGLYEAVVFMSR